jgi:hypothetical protein
VVVAQETPPLPSSRHSAPPPAEQAPMMAAQPTTLAAAGMLQASTTVAGTSKAVPTSSSPRIMLTPPASSSRASQPLGATLLNRQGQHPAPTRATTPPLQLQPSAHSSPKKRLSSTPPPSHRSKAAGPSATNRSSGQLTHRPFAPAAPQTHSPLPLTASPLKHNYNTFGDAPLNAAPSRGQKGALPLATSPSPKHDPQQLPLQQTAGPQVLLAPHSPPLAATTTALGLAAPRPELVQPSPPAVAATPLPAPLVHGPAAVASTDQIAAPPPTAGKPHPRIQQQANATWQQHGLQHPTPRLPHLPHLQAL